MPARLTAEQPLLALTETLTPALVKEAAEGRW